MSGNNNIDVLFTTIGKALKTSHPIELSEAIANFQKNKIPNKKEIDDVIKLVADEYSVSVRSLLSGTSNGKVRDAKYTCYVLLHLSLGLSARFIAKKVFNNWFNSVNRGINYYRKCDVKIKQDREFLEIYNKLEAKIATWPNH